MTRLDTLVGLLPSLYRRQKQVNRLADIRISTGDVLVFTQRDVLVGEDYGPLIIICDSIIGDADIEITVTYDIAQTIDYIISANSDKDSMYYLGISPYLISDISYKVATADKGTAGDIISFYNMTGNHAKIMYLGNSLNTEVNNIIHEYLRYTVLSSSRDDWIDKQAESWKLDRLPAETDDELITRIIIKSTPTDGTISSVIARVRSYLGLSESDAITVLESYDQDGWLLGVSRFLADGQSELIFTGDVSIQPMQFQMSIAGYSVAANGNVTCASVLAADTVTVNGLDYTAVTGTKADNTEFSIDTGDTECATDLTDSIREDTRSPVTTTIDLTATSTGSLVIITAREAGTGGNSIDLASSNETRLLTSGLFLSGGFKNGDLSETDVENYLRGIINVSASPIVRFT